MNLGRILPNPIVCCCSVAQLCLTLCDPRGCSLPGFRVLHCLLEFGQTRVHWQNIQNVNSQNWPPMGLPLKIAPSTKIEESRIKIERKRQIKIFCKWEKEREPGNSRKQGNVAVVVVVLILYKHQKFKNFLKVATLAF